MPESASPPERETALTSNFPAHFFSPAGVLAGVDPARLPTPADALPGFEGPASPTPEFGEISDTWARLHLKGIDEASDPRKATLVHLVPSPSEDQGLRVGAASKLLEGWIEPT